MIIAQTMMVVLCSTVFMNCLFLVSNLIFGVISINEFVVMVNGPFSANCCIITVPA